MHYAARNRSPDVTQRLLDAGADPNTADREGRTPIDVAPAPDSTPTVTVLRAASTQQQEPVHKEPRGGRRPGKTAEEYTHEFAAKLTQQIEAGTAPWQKSWKRGENRIPENFSTEKQYQGGNTLELMVQRTANSYNDHRWGTYRQIAAAGGHVRKGEQGTRILAYKPPKRRDTQETTTPGEGAEEKRDERDAEKTRRGTWRHYTVFNVEQAEGLKLPERKGVADSPMGSAAERGKSHPGQRGHDPGGERRPGVLQHGPRSHRVARAGAIQERRSLLPDRAP